jgi:hypothetical protein
MAIPLPYQDAIDRTSGPRNQGFNIVTIEYSPSISQRAFDGPTQEASRTEEWTVVWKLLERLTPEEVISYGRPSTFDVVKKFYEDNYLGKVEWRPFESDVTRVWEIKPNSLKQKNPAGCIFELKFSLKFIHNI